MRVSTRYINSTRGTSSKCSNVRLTDDGRLSSCQGRSSSASTFHESFRWCDVLGFVPAGSVSSSSTLQIFREVSHLWGLLCQLVYLLGRFPSPRHVQGSTLTGVFEGECWQLTHPSLGFPFYFSLFCSKLIESVKMMTYVAWLSPLEAIQRMAWATTSTSIVKLEVETV